MPLIDRNKMPPGGYQFRQPEINWLNPSPFLPFKMVAQMIQRARINNPHAGLNPNIESCEQDLDTYTCRRLGNDPAWCLGDQEVARVAAQAKERKGCGSCGRKKKQ